MEFAATIDREKFQERGMETHAIIRAFEVMGEATKRLSPGFREAHPHLPWRKVAGLRDVLIHAYDTIDLVALWDIIEDVLPEFTKELASIRSRLGWP